jgi:flagellar biosynthesis/type III secretory pathway protein FliH
MRARTWTQVLAGAVVTATWAWGAGAGAQVIRRSPSGTIFQAERQDRAQYNRGYEQGLKEGEKDAQKHRAFNAWPNGNGRNQRDVDFRQGFEAGYRAGFDQVRRAVVPRDDRRGGSVGRRVAGGYQEPAFARGYSDGYEDGLNDGKDHHNYDPVGERDYRNADQGYYGSYGSKDAYKNNYRAGFRQGYEDGYRESNYRR